ESTRAASTLTASTTPHRPSNAHQNPTRTPPGRSPQHSPLEPHTPRNTSPTTSLARQRTRPRAHELARGPTNSPEAPRTRPRAHELARGPTNSPEGPAKHQSQTPRATSTPKVDFQD